MKHNEEVVFSKEGGIASISINRAKSMNAISADVADALGKCIDEAGKDPALIEGGSFQIRSCLREAAGAYLRRTF